MLLTHLRPLDGPGQSLLSLSLLLFAISLSISGKKQQNGSEQGTTMRTAEHLGNGYEWSPVTGQCNARFDGEKILNGWGNPSRCPTHAPFGWGTSLELSLSGPKPMHRAAHLMQPPHTFSVLKNVSYLPFTGFSIV